jgi:hypothetical protein
VARKKKPLKPGISRVTWLTSTALCLPVRAPKLYQKLQFPFDNFRPTGGSRKKV